MEHLFEAVAAETGGIAVPCDVSDEGEIRTLMDTTTERLGHIDVLINNAGAGPARLPVHELPVEAWDHAMNVNLRGLFL